MPAAAQTTSESREGVSLFQQIIDPRVDVQSISNHEAVDELPFREPAQQSRLGAGVGGRER